MLLDLVACSNVAASLSLRTMMRNQERMMSPPVSRSGFGEPGCLGASLRSGTIV
jgi:hypothetical protein